MSVSVARLRSFMGSRFSCLAVRRDLLVVALLVQGVCAAGYLYLQHGWIESAVVQSLKNVSSMHLRSFEQLQKTLNYQLESIGEATLAKGSAERVLPGKNILLQQEVKNPWLDTAIVLNPVGDIVSVASGIPLSSILPPIVLKTNSFKDSPLYRTFLDSRLKSSLFFAPSEHATEQDGGGMVVFRRILSADGEWLGSAVGYTSRRSLSALLNTDAARGFDLGENGVLSIFDQHTNETLYRYVYTGKPAYGSPSQLQTINIASFQASRYGPDVKFYRSTVDGLERLAVLTPLHNGQWQQVVAASKDVYLLNWRVQVLFSVVAFACLAVLQWLLAGFLRQNNQQRELLSLVLDTVDAYVYFKDSERRYVYVNAKTAELFGLPAEQIIGRLDHEVLPPEVADHFWASDSQVHASGCKQSNQEVATMPGGETRYFASTKVPVQQPDQPLALIGVSIDVTELHEQTIAREAAEQELAAHNHYLHLNNQVLELLGQNAALSEVLDTMVRSIDDHRPGVLGAVFLMADNGKELVGCAAPNLPEECTNARIPIGEMNGAAAMAVHRGETVIVADIATDPRSALVREAVLDLGLRASWAEPIKSSGGKILGVLTLYQREPAVPNAHDLALLADYAKLAQLVIERSRLAEALQESQTLYRLIAENSNDLIWVMEYPFLTCSYVSPSAERLRGWTAEEVLDQQLEEMVSASSVSLVNETLQECMRRIGKGDLMGRFFTMELEHLHKDGHVVPIESKGTIMLDSNGRPTHIIGSARDISERKAAEEIVRNMAFLDQLTGLPNRRMMEDRMGQMLALAKREQRKISLLFIDLDGFKAVNDQHGHGAGDWLLQQVAARIGAVLRTSDTASRIGGDEFVILLPDARTTEDAVLVAEKIRSVLEMPFVMDNGVVLEISSSIGVAMYPDQADNERDLLHFGDEAMYRAKKGGRNAVEVFDAKIPSGGSSAVGT